MDQNSKEKPRLQQQSNGDAEESRKIDGFCMIAYDSSVSSIQEKKKKTEEQEGEGGKSPTKGPLQGCGSPLLGFF